MVVVVKKEGKGVKCEVCGARSDETMRVCRSPVEKCRVQSSFFRFVQLSASSLVQHLSTGRKKEGRKNEGREIWIVAKPVGATPAANEDAHRVSLRVDSIFPVFFCVSFHVSGVCMFVHCLFFII